MARLDRLHDYWATGSTRGATPAAALTPEEATGVAVGGLTMRHIAGWLSPPTTATYEAAICAITDPGRTWLSYRQADDQLMNLQTAVDWGAEPDRDARNLGHAIDDVRWFLRGVHLRSDRPELVFPTSAQWLIDDLEPGQHRLPTELDGYWRLLAAGVELGVALDLADPAPIATGEQP